jgi:hypothetical protein
VFKKNSIYRYITYVFLLLTLISSCRKSDRNVEVINPAPAENCVANMIFIDIFKTIHQFSMNNSIVNAPVGTTMSNSLNNCIDNIEYAFFIQPYFPNKIILKYNNAISCSHDSRTISGDLSLLYSKNYSDSLCVIEVGFKNYAFESNEVSGSVKITYRGRNANGNKWFAMNLNDINLENDTLSGIWSGTRNFEWIEGDNDVSTNNDVFLVTGKSSGRTTKGNKYNATIETPLEINFSCNWIVSGEEIVVPENLTERYVDYGSCDNEVAISYKRTNYTVSLP